MTSEVKAQAAVVNHGMAGMFESIRDCKGFR